MLDALNNLVEVRLGGIYMGQRTLNIFHYKLISVISDGVSVEEFAETFAGSIPPLFSPIQVEDFHFDKVEVLDLNPTTEITEHSFDQQGEGTGEPLPAFMAVGFKLNRLSVITRPGFKRIPGISEGSLTNGEWTFDPGAVEDILTGLAVPLVVVGSDGEATFRQVIIGRNSDGTYDFARVNDVTSVALMSQPTTQNSRKVGQGS